MTDKTNAELADAFEKGTIWLGSTEDGFEGATEQIIAALRSPEPEAVPIGPNDTVGFQVVNGMARAYVNHQPIPIDLNPDRTDWERQPSSDKVLVPREPTAAMLERGWNESRHELAGTPSARACYRAMLAAAEAEG